MAPKHRDDCRSLSKPFRPVGRQSRRLRPVKPGGAHPSHLRYVSLRRTAPPRLPAAERKCSAGTGRWAGVPEPADDRAAAGTRGSADDGPLCPSDTGSDERVCGADRGQHRGGYPSRRRVPFALLSGVQRGSRARPAHRGRERVAVRHVPQKPCRRGLAPVTRGARGPAVSRDRRSRSVGRPATGCGTPLPGLSLRADGVSPASGTG